MARDRLQNYGQQQQQQYGDYSAPGNPYSAPQQPYNGGYDQQPAYGQQPSYNGGGAYSSSPYGGGNDGDFFSNVNTINGLLADLKQKIENVRKAHQATLHSANADTISYSDQLSEDARNSRQQCKDAIKALAKQAKGNKQLKAQVDTVNKEFQMLLKEHQAIETTYRNQTKERAVRQFKIVKPDATDEELKAVTSEDNPQIFAQALLNTTAYGAARNAYREVQDRHTEIQKIQKSMEELGQMFNEMAMLVEQQDEDIRQIEGNAQDVDTNVTKGVTELSGAVAKAKAARKKKWICFWIVVIIAIILIAVLCGVLIPKK